MAGANNRRVRRIRHLRDTLNPLEEYHHAKFRLRFRLRKDSVITLTAILENEHQTRRGLPITPVQQVLLTLRLNATVSFYQVIGDLLGMCNYAFHKVIHRVSRVIP